VIVLCVMCGHTYVPHVAKDLTEEHRDDGLCDGCAHEMAGTVFPLVKAIAAIIYPALLAADWAKRTAAQVAARLGGST
jgi:hypothetical protein